MVEPVQALDSETRQVIGGLEVSRGDEPDATGVVFLPSVDAGPRHVPSGGKPGMLGEPGRGPYKGSRSGGERSGEVLDRLAEAPAEGGRDHREEHRGQEAVDLDHDLYGEQRAVTFRLDVDTDRPPRSGVWIRHRMRSARSVRRWSPDPRRRPPRSPG